MGSAHSSKALRPEPLQMQLSIITRTFVAGVSSAEIQPQPIELRNQLCSDPVLSYCISSLDVATSMHSRMRTVTKISNTILQCFILRKRLKNLSDYRWPSNVQNLHHSSSCCENILYVIKSVNLYTLSYCLSVCLSWSNINCVAKTISTSYHKQVSK